MCSERASVEEFLAKGFGYAAVCNGGFACWCMSEYNLWDKCEVGIETAPEHRRRGLATLVASAMFRHAAGVGSGESVGTAGRTTRPPSLRRRGSASGASPSTRRWSRVNTLTGMRPLSTMNVEKIREDLFPVTKTTNLFRYC